MPIHDRKAAESGRLESADSPLPLPFATLGAKIDLPQSTLEKLRATGKGPHTFKIGRRLYVRQVDLRAWIDRLAEGETA